MSVVKKAPVVVGTRKVLMVEYYYLNQTGPAEGEGPRSSFVGNGFKLNLTEDEKFEEGYDFVPGSGIDVITIKEEETEVAGGWLWRTIRTVDEPIYGLPQG